MCGRYYIDDSTWSAVTRDFPELKDRLTATTGDVVPSQAALSLTAGEDETLLAARLSWGFFGYAGADRRETVPGSKEAQGAYPADKLVINARAEGIFEKPMFAESIQRRRCVLPAAGFYEWDRSRQKVTFTQDDTPVIYLAGIWRPYGPEQRFAIITREANESMLPVHDRMPLMIAPENVRGWLFDGSRTKEYLTQPLPLLTAAREYEQMSLFDIPKDTPLLARRVKKTRPF